MKSLTKFFATVSLISTLSIYSNDRNLDDITKAIKNNDIKKVQHLIETNNIDKTKLPVYIDLSQNLVKKYQDNINSKQFFKKYSLPILLKGTALFAFGSSWIIATYREATYVPSSPDIQDKSFFSHLRTSKKNLIGTSLFLVTMGAYLGYKGGKTLIKEFIFENTNRKKLEDSQLINYKLKDIK